MGKKEDDEARDLIDYYARQRLISPQARDKLYGKKSLTAVDVEKEREKWEEPSGRWYEKNKVSPPSQIQEEVVPPPAHQYGPRPKLNQQQIGGLQNLLLQVREGKIAAPTQDQSTKIQELLLGTPGENEARSADYAETERIKQLVARAGANRDTGASFNINPITGRPSFHRVVPEGFEEAYSEKQKQQISQLNNVVQDVENNPDFDERDKAVAIRKAMTRLNNIKPSMRVKEPPPPMGDSWDGTFIHPETGDVMGYDRNKKPRVLTHYKDTKKGIEEAWLDKGADRKAEDERELLRAHSRRMEKEADIQAAREERISNKRLEIAADDSAVQDGVDAKGKPKYRARNREEIDEIMKRSGLLDVRQSQDVSQTRVATPEQLQYGPSGLPPADPYARGPQAPAMSQAPPPVVQIRNDADFDKLPSGALFRAPNGKLKRKP